MKMQSSKMGTFTFFFMLALLSHNMVIPVLCRSLQSVGDQKTYYSPDPHTPGGSSHGSPTPSHGSGTPSYGSGTPSTPSHGGGGSHGSPPKHHKGSGGSCGKPPSKPSHGGGGYYHSPPIVSPPYVPTPTTPSPYVPTPTTPSTPTPTTPSTPTTTPSTPVVPDPNTPDPSSPPSFSGTCDYWKNHPKLILELFGFWGTLGSIFGTPATPAFTPSLSLQQALANTRTDGLGSLYREGTASLLNSMVNQKFPFTTQQVKDMFSSALISNNAAAAQANLFKYANEGKMKPRS